MLKEVNRRVEVLISRLREEYLKEPAVQVDPAHANRIDIVPVSEIYNSTVRNKEYVQDRISQLIQNYSSDRIYEISPKNTGSNTSYTEDKKILVLCLRHKNPDAKGVYALHDVNTIMFVVLHELTHMANQEWNHPGGFWTLFKFMLENAVEAGVYDPVDYGKKPIVYCGLELHYNPLYDRNL